MTNEEFARRIGSIYKQVLNLRKNEDYVVNQPQMDKFIQLVEFFEDAARELNGKMDFVDLEPKEISGGVTASFIVFDLHGKWLERFSKVILFCSAITMDVRNVDKVCISCTVPNVFVHK